MQGPGERARFGAAILAALSLPAAANAGSHADAPAAPAAPPRPRWWQPLREVIGEIGANNVSMMSAGVAFYMLLAIFPGLSALISLYGLVANPSGAQQLLLSLVGVLPAEAIKLLSGELQALTHAPPAKLGIGLVISLALALWSANSGTAGLMSALTVACDQREERGLLRFYSTAAVLTLGLVAVGLVSLLLVAVMPAMLNWLPSPEFVSLVRWPVLAALAIGVLGALYRFAPCRGGRDRGWISPGAVAATLLWILVSAGFSFYVARFGSYDRTYGPLGAVIVLLMWLYLTAFIVLAGAELDTVVARRKSARLTPPGGGAP